MIYQTSFDNTVKDFRELEPALQEIEKVGYGSLVTFIEEDNLPYCLPKKVARATSCHSYHDNEWCQIAIHSHYPIRMNIGVRPS